MAAPSIFNLISALDQDIFGNKKQELLLNGDTFVDEEDNDEYESDEDRHITVIDISQNVQNPTMPNKPKRKYSNSNNLMLMSVDDHAFNDEPEYLSNQ